ncbi:SMI1/KNR4 family protein [Paenibacillus glacialis]|uniref:1,3-beta-glucan synthase regulator n=1 Tax=Paenibacillus glacialis TaxID=494026 RepID=A0A168EAD1_9BACL|nr:SMI1/KNR4 family protein [Paenibacillus glacialis]OAB35031.1 1,3-beta-glucan synthase regulator [Paenibacillus glacialis]
MSNLPVGIEQILGVGTYKRQNRAEVHEALIRLGVAVSDTFREFYNKYSGPFWEEDVPFELLDIVEEKNNIESYTLISRKEHGWPKQFLVLSEMSTNAVLVLDTITDKVYKVNFEGGDELLIQGELKETWVTFQDFLKEYFNC